MMNHSFLWDCSQLSLIIAAVVLFDQLLCFSPFLIVCLRSSWRDRKLKENAETGVYVDPVTRLAIYSLLHSSFSNKSEKKKLIII